jgi:hypothetical protein
MSVGGQPLLHAQRIKPTNTQGGLSVSDRVRWIEYKGARILVADYSGLSGAEYLSAIDGFKAQLLRQPPGSVVTLTDVTGSVVTEEIKDKLKELAEQTQGISKAAAAVGITGFKRAIAVLIRRDLYWASSFEEAMEWLADQAAQ